MKKITPDYKKIYTEMIKNKYPDKTEMCLPILNKKIIGIMDIINLNTLICSRNNQSENQKLKSYDRTAIFEILNYQKQQGMNNATAAKHFNLSRNTIHKWKKTFLS